MPEHYRDQIDQPNFYSERVADGEQGFVTVAQNEIENAKTVVATQDHVEIAHLVANTIKPDIDYVVGLEKEESSEDPLQTAAYVEIGDKVFLTGVKPSKEAQRITAAKGDIERNARNAVKIATEKHLGGAALELVESKQKVADMRLR